MKQVRLILFTYNNRLVRPSKEGLKQFRRKLHQTDTQHFITRPLSEYRVKLPLSFDGKVAVVTGGAAGKRGIGGVIEKFLTGSKSVLGITGQSSVFDIL